MSTIVPWALLGIAVTNLAVACFRWGAGGKHQVMSSLIMGAVATALVLPDDTAGRTAALWIAAGLLVVALMTTPGARRRRMHLELALLGAALAVVWVASSAFFLAAALLLAAFGAMVVRGRPS
jgi:hypothetical protein